MATSRHRTLLGSLLAAATLSGTFGAVQTGLASPALASDTATTSSTTSSTTSTVRAASTTAAPVLLSPLSSYAVSPSGTRAPRTSLSGWRLHYAEDFRINNATGTFPSGGYERHWGVYEDGWKDTSKNGTYMPSKVLSVKNGVLDYAIRTEAGKRLVAAPWLMDTKGKTYGRFSIRFRSDALPGYKTAWLLWPDSERWPDDGEIDFPEGNLSAGSKIHAFHHYASSRGGQDAFPTSVSFTGGWHTVTVEWRPGRVIFFLDGKVIGSSTKMVPSKPMHWVLQTETNLDGYVPSSLVSGHVQVDWVAYWTKA